MAREWFDVVAESGEVVAAAALKEIARQVDMKTYGLWVDAKYPTMRVSVIRNSPLPTGSLSPNFTWSVTCRGGDLIFDPTFFDPHSVKLYVPLADPNCISKIVSAIKQLCPRSSVG